MARSKGWDGLTFRLLVEPGREARELFGFVGAWAPAAADVAMAFAATGAEKIETLFAGPQRLDRVWVRLGFIPVPDAELPEVLRGRPGIGLFGWRDGSALWSAAGRGRDRRAAPALS